MWISVLYLGWTLFQIPYLSIGYDLEKDYFLRTKLSANRELFILFGLFFSLGFPMFFNFSNAELLSLIVYIAIFSGFVGVIVMLNKIPDNRKTNKDVELKSVFKNLSRPFDATRYHSLIVEKSSLPSCLQITAWTKEDEIMGLMHNEFPLHGVQFHPESILTIEGKKLLKNFLML